MSVIRETILETQEDIDRYYAAFGRFISYFSYAEQRLHSLLWQMSGAPLSLIRVAFREARYSHVTTLIGHLYESRGEEPHPLYKRAVDQLGVINSTRNDMVHFGAGLDVFEETLEMAMPISNALKALPGREKSYQVSYEMLNAILHDLHTAMACLNVVIADLDQIEANSITDYWRKTAQRAWLYKSPLQSGSQGARQKRAPRQRSPRAPSQK